MYRDRKDAGEKLAVALDKYKDSDVIVLAIPRGGVEVGYHVARHLNADFSLIVARKLPFPNNPESGFGAIAEDGSMFLFEDYAKHLPEKVLDDTIEEQKREIARRIEVLRDGEALPQLEDRIAVLVDDGIAMGSTMKASIKLCRNCRVGKIVVASPVAGRETIREIAKLVDDVVILESPYFFRAVADSYVNWYDVSDEEVINILKQA